MPAYPGTVGPASTGTELLIGVLLIAVGGVLGFNVKKVSTKLLKANWDENRPWYWPNPYQMVGWSFLLGGVLALGVVVYRSV